MKNWIKENWFKLIILIVLIWVAWNLVGYLNYNSRPHSQFEVQNYSK